MSNKKKICLISLGVANLSCVGYILLKLFNNDFLGMFVGFLAFVIFYIILNITWEEME